MGVVSEVKHEVQQKPFATTAQIENGIHSDAEKSNLRAEAMEAENAEYSMTVLQAVKAYPMACLWAVLMSSTIIMESIGNFVALPAFKQQYGIIDPATGNHVIATKWQSALQVSGQLGALIGVFIAGPLTSRVGYRWATIIGLMVLNGMIAVSYTAHSLPQFFAGQILEGLPWGIFIANAPAYCSEIVPLRLRAPATQMLQMFWAIGSIIVQAVSFVYQDYPDRRAYSVPLAIQWIFPTPLAIAMFLAPESPWWLVRHGKYDQAVKSVNRLGRKSRLNAVDTVAMMRRVVSMEATTKKPNYPELFKGTDLRRTLIVCGVYAAQNLTGNLIANQAVYFFQQSGVGERLSFALGLITSGLQTVAVISSWVLTTYFGRRPIYLWGSAFNLVMLLSLGIAASVPRTHASTLAQASLGLITSVAFTVAAAPASWAIIGETSAIRLRPLTTGIGRATYYIVEIPCIFLASYMLNPTGGDLGGKCGYVWGGTALICLVVAYFQLPEMKGRSYREIDILFKRRVPARKWRQTELSINDDQ